MNRSNFQAVATACVLAATALAASAQEATPGTGPAPAARWGANYTPGWSLMTAQERTEHRAKLRSMKTYDECKAYVQQHHDLMAARAKERGGQVLAQPRRDACAALKR